MSWFWLTGVLTLALGAFFVVVRVCAFWTLARMAKRGLLWLIREVQFRWELFKAPYEDKSPPTTDPRWRRPLDGPTDWER